MKPPCKKFWSDRTFFRQHIPLTIPNSSEAGLDHIFSKQCKAKQLKRHQVIIDNCLKFSEKTRTFSFLTTRWTFRL